MGSNFSIPYIKAVNIQKNLKKLFYKKSAIVEKYFS